MKCYQCGCRLKAETERCPRCGGFTTKEAENKFFQRIDDEAEREREFIEATGYREFRKPFPNY
jgi:rRNA maturation endonuclease Nob1